MGVRQRGIKQGEQGWGERVFSQLEEAGKGAQPVAGRGRMLSEAV